jgi:hypothetical protein
MFPVSSVEIDVCHTGISPVDLPLMSLTDDQSSNRLEKRFAATTTR